LNGPSGIRSNLYLHSKLLIHGMQTVSSCKHMKDELVQNYINIPLVD